MHVLVGLLGLLLALTMLSELFVVMLVPRRVKRDPRIARQLYDLAWPYWRRLGLRLGGRSGDTLLGLFGPLGLIGMLVVWTSGLMVGYAAMQWGAGSHLGAGHVVGFGDDLYFTAGSFVTVGAAGLSPTTSLERALSILTTTSGFAVLTIVIAYLPSLFSAFSRRETNVSRLDPRAGTPPSAIRLLVRSTKGGDWETLVDYLGDWEGWAADLMETHLSYPVLAYYRSQHVGQNWLAALTTVMDSCALVVAAAPERQADHASFTFALGRHAMADLAYTFRAAPRAPLEPRLSEDDFTELMRALDENGVPLRGQVAEVQHRLASMQALYEPYALALADRLALPVAPWRARDDTPDNWRTTAFH
ncbi:MAG TPA: potassium channel family protein [Solirubrobacteraceae bacterium]|jgi:hypothetical protein|nr:potassium channel family protein [Solirubrobacteraceae bacterium]